MCSTILYTKDDSATFEHVISPFISLDVHPRTLCFAIEIFANISHLP